MHDETRAHMRAQRRSALSEGAAFARSIPPPVAWLTAAATLLAILGAIAIFASLPAFDLNGEVYDTVSVPPLFSAGLLAFAALLALRSRVRLPGGARWIALGLFFGFMVADETLGLHERLGHALATDWQAPYVPIVALGALIWFAALRSLWTSAAARLLWIAGAAAWVGSQLLEALAWSGPTLNPGGQYLNYSEEVLEMVGTLLFIWALLVAAPSANSTSPWRQNTADPEGATTAAPGSKGQPVESSAYSRTWPTSST